MAPSELTALVRIVVAFLLGGAIGLQRQLAHEPAGLRTHMLVAAGAATFVTLSILGLQPLGGPAIVGSDRIASQVVTGVGFLGAGTIWRTPSTVHGLTTAASIWMTAAIGLLCADGFYLLATVTTLLTVVALFLIRIPERKLLPVPPDPDASAS